MNLKKLMIEREMTAADIARKTGMTQAALSRYINDKRIPRLNSVIKIAKALNVPIELLMKGVDE
jgi:transcriptional regulator with XRE-family HTH domain